MRLRLYLLSIMLLFSNNYTNSMENIDSQVGTSKFDTTALLTVCGAACITYYTIQWAYRTRQKSLRTINRYLAKKIFSAEVTFSSRLYPKDYLDNHCTFNFLVENFNPITAYSFIKNNPTLLRILLKILLFFDYQNTQKNFNELITTMYTRYFLHNIKDTDKFDTKWKDMYNIIHSLFGIGIDPRVQPFYRFNILREASYWGDIRMVEYLFTEIKLDPDDRDRQGNYNGNNFRAASHRNTTHQANPLYMACHRKQDAIIQLFIKHNTNTHPFLDKTNTAIKSKSCFQDVIAKEPSHTIENPLSIKLAKDFVAYSFLKNSSFNHEMTLKQFWHIREALHMLPKELYNTIYTTPYKKQFSLDQLLDVCFICDKKIWQPQQQYSGDKFGLYRLDDNYKEYIQKEKDEAKKYFQEKEMNGMDLTELIMIYSNSIKA